jgi:hypothetical protein
MHLTKQFNKPKKKLVVYSPTASTYHLYCDTRVLTSVTSISVSNVLWFYNVMLLCDETQFGRSGDAEHSMMLQDHTLKTRLERHQNSSVSGILTVHKGNL